MKSRPASSGISIANNAWAPFSISIVRKPEAGAISRTRLPLNET
jgi:hypothetical protein